MYNLAFWISPNPDNPTAVFARHGSLVPCTRVPCVGELLSLGRDEGGQEADYEVVFVRHFPYQTDGASAAVYTRRVSLKAVLDAYTAKVHAGDVPWNPTHWPANATPTKR